MINTFKNWLNNLPKILIWIFAFQLFRFFLVPFMGLMPQDAYYYLYGQNLSWSYFDHPGMIGYLLRFTSEVFGKSVFVIKLTDFTITSLSIYFFYKLALLYFEKQRAYESVLILVSTIFISILLLNSTPDVPLILFWTLTIYYLHKAVFNGKNLHWLLAGLFFGLAFNSKYTAIVLLVGFIVFLILSKKHKKQVLNPWFFGFLIIAFLVSFPVFWWNYQHDFASFAFQSTNRGSSISKFEINFGFLFGAFAHQILLLLPILFGAFLWLIFKVGKPFFLKLHLPEDRTLFLLAFFIPTFLGFLLITPIYWVKLNWLMPSYITGVLLITPFFTKKMMNWQLGISVVLHIILAIQIIFYVFPIKSDDTYVGWKELSIKVNQLQNSYPNAFIFSDDNYKTSAVLNFYLDEKVFAQNIIGKPALHFDYLKDNLKDLNGKDAIFIDSDTNFKNNDKKGSYPIELDTYFESIIELNPILTDKNTRKERKFWVYYCKNYQSKK